VKARRVPNAFWLMFGAKPAQCETPVRAAAKRQPTRNTRSGMKTRSLWCIRSGPSVEPQLDFATNNPESSVGSGRLVPKLSVNLYRYVGQPRNTASGLLARYGHCASRLYFFRSSRNRS
jgi:hypothetical protein